MKKLLVLLMAAVLFVSLAGCGGKDAPASADDGADTATVAEEITTEATIIPEPTTFPAVQLKQSPKTYEDDGWIFMSATNYYGEAYIGSTLQFGGSAFPGISVNVPANTKMGTKAGDDVSYCLFITQDGTHTINYLSEGAMGTLQYSIFSASINGNDVTFEAGKIVDSGAFGSSGCKVKVSGFFLVEVYAQFGTDEGIEEHSTLNPCLVLSEKEVDEYFATGKIAKYGDFDFSGLKELIQAN